MNIFNFLKHYYITEINMTYSYLLRINISKTDFIVLYDSIKMLRFEINNVVNV